MHDAIYEWQSELTSELVISLAKKVGLDVSAMAEARQKRVFLERVKQDFMTGVRSGVNGTPTFFIDGRRHDEDTNFEGLVAVMEAERRALQ